MFARLISAPARLVVQRNALRFFSSRCVAGNIFYTKDHEYVKFETPDLAAIGISNFAQENVGELVFIDLPEVVSL
jgi:hypothetical protein